ncbi:MAG: thermonuclease family protein [Candidatus Hydrogenedentes bacterium]|nr:thermonuclease family protein [Candidatus Hydrogenedentota bacterium]
MLIRLFSLVFLFSVVALLGAAGAETLTGEVVSIADGDTVTVLRAEEQVKVRLHGVDAPESGQDFGRAARDYVAERCFRKEVTVFVTDTDRYGRKVGVVILKDGRVLNHELVAAGLAHWYARYAPEDEALRRLQEEARAARRGLWSRPDAVTPEAFRRGEGRSGIAPYNPPSAGTGPEARSQDTAPADRALLYVTDTGTKYHRGSCRMLRSSRRAIAREQAERDYEPCGICLP